MIRRVGREDDIDVSTQPCISQEYDAKDNNVGVEASRTLPKDKTYVETTQPKTGLDKMGVQNISHIFEEICSADVTYF